MTANGAYKACRQSKLVINNLNLPAPKGEGFGFINQPIQTQIFLYTLSGLVDQIRENDQIEYDEERGKKGMNAVNVTVLN
jgi:cold shock protein